jgi:hypothetical protein
MAYTSIDDPCRFKGKALVLKAQAPDDYVVTIDGLTAGRIFKTSRTDRTVWLWTLTGPYLNAPTLNLGGSGEVLSLKDAKAALRGNFDKWLAWTLAGGWPVAWNA